MMQRQHQQRVNLYQSVNNDFQFQLHQPSNDTDSRVKNTTHLAKSMEIENQKSSHASQLQQQQQQDSALGTERLTSLHAKLHQEADKIRKWKVQTEMEMKHKDKKLGEASMTIESLRKSILELQLENENLSSKLQDELSNREELLQRIQHTRDLIGALKNQEKKLEEKLSSCETERTELKYLQKEHAQHFEEMTHKFKNLQLDAEQHHEALTSEVQQEQEKRQEIQTELEHKIKETDSQIKSLTNQIDEKNIALREVHLLLQQNEEKLHATDKDLSASQQKVTSLAEELDVQQAEVEKFKTECSLLQNEKEQLATELVEERHRADAAQQQEESVQEALNNSVAIFNQREATMHRDQDILRAELADEQKRLKEARAQLTETVTLCESLKSSRDVLLLEKTEMELCLEKLKVELTDLQSEKYKNKEDIVNLETEVENYRQQLHEEEQCSSRLQVQVDEMRPRYIAMENEVKLLQQDTSDLKQTILKHQNEVEHAQHTRSDDVRQNEELQQTITQLHSQLDSLQTEQVALQAKLDTAQQQLSDKENEMLATTAELQKASASLQDMTQEHKDAKTYICEVEAQLTAFGEEKTRFESQIMNLEKEKEKLQKEQEECGQEVESERQNRTEQQELLEQKLKDATADIKAKNKAVKEQEKELKSVRGKLTTQDKKREEQSRELDYLKQELQISEQAREHSDKIIAALQSHLEQETLSTKEQAKQLEQLKEEVTQAQKDKTETSVLCERQIIEMTSTLEKYTSDHQKLLAQKDREIEEMRNKNNHLTLLSQQKERMSMDDKVEAQRLQQQTELLRAEMEQLEKDKAAEIETLKTQLRVQVKLVEEMENSLTEQQAIHKEQLMEVEGGQGGCPARGVPTTPRAQIHGQGGDNPQRSIMRQSGSVTKRRKVAFISPSVDLAEPGRSDSDTSIELEIEDHMLKASVGAHTPLRLRQSPHGKSRHVVSSPAVYTPSRYPKPGTPAKLTKPQPQNSQNNTSEVTKIKEKEFHKTPNMRKAPMRTSKFFRSSPKERTVLKKKEEAKEKLSWFDDDAVYGFGCED